MRIRSSDLLRDLEANDPDVFAAIADVDRSMIRVSLDFSPRERLRRNDRDLRMIAGFQADVAEGAKPHPTPAAALGCYDKRPMATAKQFLKALRAQGDGKPKTRDEFWREELEVWAADVNSLIASVTQWLAPVVEGNAAWLENHAVDLEEPDVGRYASKSLEIHLPDDRVVTLRPRGLRIAGVIQTGKARILGARGRVDLECGARREVLLRFKSKDGKPEWRSFAGGDETQLTEEVFFALLARVSGVQLD